MTVNKNSIVRDYGNKTMKNKYYEVLEVINKEGWMEDAVVCPHLAEEMIEEGYLEHYDDSSKSNLSMCDAYVNIVEAFDKVYVFINTYGDTVSTVHIDKDGEVVGSSYGIPSLDLDSECYYVGDEPSHMGKEDPFTSVNQWVWKTPEIDCPSKCFGISKDSMAEFIGQRQDYLISQAKKV